MTARSRIGVTAAVLLVPIGLFGVHLWHEFRWFGARSKGAEARSTLKRLCLAQQRLADPAARYRELGEEVERGNRYAYFVSPGLKLEERDTNHGPPTADPLATGVQVDVPRMGPAARVTATDLPAEFAGGLRLGPNGECPKCSWVLVAAGSIDLDPELDVWSVATVARAAKGEQLAACQPFHEHDDIPVSPVRALFQ